MRPALLVAFLPGLALATTYEVGPGKPYGSIGAVPWESLAAGDTVLVHARAAPYAEKWVVNARGTEGAPITVRGVPDTGGALPVIEGSGATTRSVLNYWNEERGVIKVGGSNVPADGTPAWVVIERLHVRGARPPARFTGRNGDTAYAQNAAGIYVEKGDHVTVRGCELEGNGNGLFVAAASTGVLVEGNFVHGNGNAGSIYEHNSYTEALGITFQWNRYGPLLANPDGSPLALGNNLKDRSAGTLIRWNWIEGGNRALDLVDAEDSAALVADPSYAVTRVYGNVLLELDDGLNSQVVHFGGDSGTAADYRPELHFWNNTVVSTRSGNTTLVRLSSTGQTARLWNNAIHATAGGGRLALAEGGGGIELGGSWLTAGWVASHGTTGPIADAGGNQAGAAPGFVDLAGQDFGPAAGSPLIGAAALLPAELAADPLDRQYLRHLATAPRADAGRTVGAFAAGGGGAAPGAKPGTATGGCGCSGGAGGGVALTLLAAAASRAWRGRCPRRHWQAGRAPSREKAVPKRLPA
ncbi:MAG TPA: right-handed parallel beta-helix repeat-containing protein [Anaeromyxobacteraceae bacterium]|nr:right-handed parallel beta-helix repeat-containing protein [Anaeromyxobacteraceae bacterium]